jgi:hypothetical protein
MQTYSIRPAPKGQPRPFGWRFPKTLTPAPQPAGLTRAQLREIVLEQLG